MLGHMLGEINSIGFTPESAKAMAKYTDRLMITAGQLRGIDIASATALGAKARTAFEDAEMLLAQARKNPAVAARATAKLTEAKDGIEALLADILKGSKDAEIAATGAEKEAAKHAAHAVDHMLDLLAHGGHVGGAVDHYLSRGEGDARSAE